MTAPRDVACNISADIGNPHVAENDIASQVSRKRSDFLLLAFPKLLRLLFHATRQLFLMRVHLVRDPFVGQSDHLSRENPGIRRVLFADRNRGDWNPRGHLHGRKQ